VDFEPKAIKMIYCPAQKKKKKKKRKRKKKRKG
jgi:hypothetical protein